ncbi:hypothetical protein KTO58_19345 [Chitinophaga pendula]|uniref:hypothetical protein n=1 Tax=Chitinophaga TaxID=79328 RepID=UPI000BAEF893|nr:MULTISPECIES: hypothetical protein [Chitinophaga]ASZ11172.1 hypothetical protein CK934_09460 [Chitinophaga sp. MD30]UCJ05831.1 hypothetical protein KTO58_19345 [Chitinophaga pendula]
MSLNFKLRLDELNENDPARKISTSPEGEFYGAASHVRNVCFVLLDSNRTFLNYGYLIAGDYLPSSNKIVLLWTTHTVTLTGIRLEPLYYDFMLQLPRQIVCMDARYNATAQQDTPVVNAITIQHHNV